MRDNQNERKALLAGTEVTVRHIGSELYIQTFAGKDVSWWARLVQNTDGTHQVRFLNGDTIRGLFEYVVQS